MSNNNKAVREKLERIYGHICMLHEGLKINGYSKSKVRYKGKSIEQQLTLHHLKPKSKGGATSVENGAVVCRGCHDFIEQTSEENRARINKLLQEYKECKVIDTDDFETQIEIDFAEMELTKKKINIYDRRKIKDDTRKCREEYERDSYTN